MMASEQQAVPVAQEIKRLIGEAKEFADYAQTEGFDASDALDLIREFAALTPDATQTREAEGEEAAHLRTIDERDALHEALSDAYRAVCGREPQWSNLFGLNDAVDDMREAVGGAA